MVPPPVGVRLKLTSGAISSEQTRELVGRRRPRLRLPPLAPSGRSSAATGGSARQRRADLEAAESPDGRLIAVPGLKTTAYLALRLWLPEAEVTVLPFDAILPAVREGRVPAGLLIHEGQLTWKEHGVRRIEDVVVDVSICCGALPSALDKVCAEVECHNPCATLSHPPRESSRAAGDIENHITGSDGKEAFGSRFDQERLEIVAITDAIVPPVRVCIPDSSVFV